MRIEVFTRIFKKSCFLENQQDPVIFGRFNQNQISGTRDAQLGGQGGLPPPNVGLGALFAPLPLPNSSKLGGKNLGSKLQNFGAVGTV